MNKAEAVYEFIDKYAYFACCGIIVMENYSMSSGGDIANLIKVFDKFMQQHQLLTELVEDGKMTEEGADSIMRSSINLLRSRSVVKFFELVNENIIHNTMEDEERKIAISKINNKINNNKVTNKDFIEFIKILRKKEENKLESIIKGGKI